MYTQKSGSSLRKLLYPYCNYRSSNVIEILYLSVMHHGFNFQKAYLINSEPRGRVIIVNNEYFETTVNLSDRDGSSYDAINLTELFEKLGFEVKAHKDLSSEVIPHCLMILSGYKTSQYWMLLVPCVRVNWYCKYYRFSVYWAELM